MMARPRLLLFDIDGTLLDTQGAGLCALLNAAEEVFSVSREQLPPLDLAGATDGGVVRKLFADAGVTMTEELASHYRSVYLHHLLSQLHAPDFSGHLLPGVADLLLNLSAAENMHIGLLTGNMRRGALLKVERFGIDHYFKEGAFGDDAEDRNLLGPIAVDRMIKRTNESFQVGEVIVIGDTPKDIACAKALGARCLAVATGSFSVAELQRHGAWRSVESMDDVPYIHSMLSTGE
jgi:phosphoglycolate phosphatase